MIYIYLKKNFQKIAKYFEKNHLFIVDFSKNCQFFQTALCNVCITPTPAFSPIFHSKTEILPIYQQFFQHSSDFSPNILSVVYFVSATTNNPFFANISMKKIRFFKPCLQGTHDLYFLCNS